MSAFDEFFGEVQWFNDGSLVITGSISREEACKAFNDFDEELNLTVENVKPDRVRYGYAPECVLDHEELGSCWYAGAYGKGSKAVWIA